MCCDLRKDVNVHGLALAQDRGTSTLKKVFDKLTDCVLLPPRDSVPQRQTEQTFTQATGVAVFAMKSAKLSAGVAAVQRNIMANCQDVIVAEMFAKCRALIFVVL